MTDGQVQEEDMHGEGRGGMRLTDAGLTYFVAKHVRSQLSKYGIAYNNGVTAEDAVGRACEGMASLMRLTAGTGFEPVVLILGNQEAEKVRREWLEACARSGEVTGL